MRSIRYHLDEHVPDAIAEGLRVHGIDVSTTREAGLLGADDTDHLEYGRAESRVVVTFDRDFAAIHATAAGRPHRGIVYRPPKTRLTIGEMIDALRGLWLLLGPDEIEDQLVYLTRELILGL